MLNQVALTDDELSLIQTSLSTTLKSYQKFKSANGNLLDWQTEQAIEEMQKLYDKFNKEYFE